MKFLTLFLIALVAFEHIYFLILEMFLWTSPKGIKIFGLKPKEFAKETKVLAANQGLYNGFLAAGLIFSIIQKDIKNCYFFSYLCNNCRYLWWLFHQTNQTFLYSGYSSHCYINFHVY